MWPTVDHMEFWFVIITSVLAAKLYSVDVERLNYSADNNSC